jgi:hypothetical protein
VRGVGDVEKGEKCQQKDLHLYQRMARVHEGAWQERQGQIFLMRLLEADDKVKEKEEEVVILTNCWQMG